MSIIDKMASFYLNNNSFEIEEKMFGSVDINENEFDVYLKISKNKNNILEKINFVFLKDDDEWDIISYFNENSPLIFINTNASKNISYLVLYAVTLLMVGVSIKINFKNIETINAKSEVLRFLDTVASNAIFNGEDFDIHYFVDDYFANKIFSCGKRFCFSVVLAFEKNKITKKEFSELIGIEETEVEKFFVSYLPLALITELKGKVDA